MTPRTEFSHVPQERRPWSHKLPPPIVMMGVPFDQLNNQLAIEIAEEILEGGEPHLLATANVDFLAQVQEDELLQRILVDADLILCDGTPLIWMSRLLGAPLPERVAGSDIVPLLLGLAAKKQSRVFLLGGRQDIAEQARQRILEDWPTLQIAGMYSPPFAPLEEMDHEDICCRIRESGADILLVSFGCPKQEKWLEMNYRHTGAKLCVGVGATIDFLAGTIRRAPVWMRKSGLEWVFRILQEPRRLAGRYWKDIWVVGPGLLRQLFHMRSQGNGKSKGTSVVRERVSQAGSASRSSETFARSDAAPMVCELPERLDVLAARDASLWPEDASPWIILKAEHTVFIDSTGTGKLVRYARTTRELGGSCFLVKAKPEVLNTLDLMKLRGLFKEVDSIEQAMELVNR